MPNTPTCTRCGETVAPGARYCWRCGNDISGEQAAVATARIPAAPGLDLQAEILARLRHATTGEYEVAGELGRGGMASVFLAHDIALDRKVAIKVMSPALVSGPGMVERFKREARTAASLSHPHIIPIYAVRETESLLFFVMKYVEGRSLDAIVKETGPLAVPMAQAILAQVGQALGYAHRRGVVHRDIKPANIMIDEEGWAVVTDFGIAKVADARGLTVTGVTIGTPAYMSPEQCAAKEITGQSDQYSLGIVGYEMITGKVPFEADSIMSIMWLHFHEPPRPIRDNRPDCPPELAGAIARMLAKSPDERWPTVEDAVAVIGAPSLSHTDPTRLRMIELARGGAGARLRATVHTPPSPLPTPPPARGTTAPPDGPPQAAPAPVEAPTVPSKPAIDAGSATAGSVSSGSIVPPAASSATSDGRAEASPASPPPTAATAPAADEVSPRRLESPRTIARPREQPRRRSWVKLTIVAGALPVLAAIGWLGSRMLFPGVWPARSGSAESGAAAAAPAPVPVAQVTVAPSPAAIAVGRELQLVTTLTDADGRAVSDREIAWTSSNPAVAQVNAAGLVTGLGTGEATITATSEDRSGTARIIVAATTAPVARVEIRPAGPRVAAGERVTLAAVARDSTGTAVAATAAGWTTTDPTIATVSPAGLVTGLREGSVTVSVAVEGLSGSTQLTVTPPRVAAVELTPTSLSLTPGDTGRLSVHVRDASGNNLEGRRVSWRSSNTAVATVSLAGVVTGRGAGDATIAATVEGRSSQARVQVNAAPAASVAVSPAAPTLRVGEAMTMSATVADAHGNLISDRALSWSTSDERVAAVSSTGAVTARSPGTATITASSGSRSGRAVVTVEAAAAAPSEPPPRPTAAVVAPRREVAAGGAHTCAITEAGAVACWGSNTRGQVGDPALGQQLAAPTLVGAGRTFRALASGTEHTCGLAADGQAWCWGLNARGQLGTRTTGHVAEPVAVSGGRTYRQLVAGDRHTCGLLANGAAWCWGDNNRGQLGDASTSAGAAPRAVAGGLPFTKLAAGGEHTCGLAEDGRIFCWGDGWSGQLGRGVRENVSQPVAVNSDVRFIDVTAGRKHTCAIARDGKAYCWGDGGSGQLGEGATSERQEPKQVRSTAGFTAIAAGAEHTCALTSGGIAHCWGRNQEGQLGDGSTSRRTAPVEVRQSAPLAQLSAGRFHTCGVTRNREVTCWGHNAAGQLGDGTLQNRPAPTAVAPGR